MSYLIFKSLHLIAMVAWFAGLFYLVRLFVYHIEAYDKTMVESKVLIPQYEIMESRLYRIILRPAMLLTWVFGLALVYSRGMEWVKDSSWLHLKLLFVFMLSGYSEHLGRIIKRLAQGEKVMTSYQFRLYNEVPTLFLLAIVLLAVFKNMTNFAYTFIAIILMGIILMVFTKIYKRIRLKDKL